MGSVTKWRRKKMSKHQHKKLLKKTRWERTHK
ncbi:MAG: AURKAIP1/COX24 domain-containing protein [Dehalococcoidia bacterium]|nr:AURKAIP1/COX24 domain-containing protein [Dehalococcoidia bacterium]